MPADNEHQPEAVRPDLADGEAPRLLEVEPRSPIGAERPEADGDIAFAPGADVPLPPPPDEVPRCGWCSALLEDPAAPICTTCGAQLVTPEPVDVPGLTAVDPALLALANRPKPEKRGLASWLAGDTIDEYPLPTESELAALAPPDAAVRREMRRLELAAAGIVVGDDAGAAPLDDAGSRPDEAAPHADDAGPRVDDDAMPPGEAIGRDPA